MTFKQRQARARRNVATRDADPAQPPGLADRVRLTADGLGASRRNDLTRVTDEIYGVGDEGVVVFPHPNRKACPDWFYVEVESKAVPGEKRYVGVPVSMMERVR